MTLAPGTRLGPYEIVAPLGAGGMGEVYRAKDTRLGREVAVKVLPQHLSSNPEVRARFEREAKTVSSLNHPHICVLFDVGREGEIDYLVMELVEGETLAAKLARGPLAPPEVLKLGGQIADALDRAHRAGVVHRDLKPGNIMLTKSGAKLMDFGLARATGLAGPAGSASLPGTMTHSPTVAAPLTAEGSIVGTFQYMAPEQLEGKEADARSDLWALGCVLYEMATGRRAFEGATQASLISAIMRDTPRPLAELSPLSPPALERLVGALLAKDPDDRVQTAHDVKLQLGWAADAALSGVSARPAATPAAAASARRVGSWLPWGVAALAAALAVAGWLLPRPAGPGGSQRRTRLTVMQPPGAQLMNTVGGFVLSPDGRTLAFTGIDSSGVSRIWLRPLDGLNPRPLAGTERADLPFWSPDSRSLGFFADGKLRTLQVETGAIETLCDAPDARGGTWGRDGVILFAPIAMGPLHSVPITGGDVTVVLRPDSASGETALRFPEFLPDGKSFTFVSLPRREGLFPVLLGRLGSSERRELVRAGAAPVYAEPGWLITLMGGRLVAYPFDARGGKLTGQAVPLGESPLVIGHDGTRAVTVSRDGILAYPGGRRSDTQLAWLDRSGRVTGMFSLPSGRWEEINVSPDGMRALVAKRSSAIEKDLCLVDLEIGQATRDTNMATLEVSSGIWSPDGRRAVFNANPRGPSDIFVQDVTGGTPEVLYQSEELFKNPYDWSPDGRLVTFESPSQETGWDVWGIPVEGERTPVSLVRTPYNEGGGWFSPDGRWLVYYSDETGAYEFYAQPYPGPGPRSSIPGSRNSVRAGLGVARWSRDGRELLFFMGDNSVKAAVVEPGPDFRCRPARLLFTAGGDLGGIAVMPDHQRFLATLPVERTPPATIIIDQGWQIALRKP
ncbi:MAG: serine/threonine-protein kinase [Solirubrobacteraceae bacterium]|nr:serine/threonine-protein kinase [Solirubrobacteraceae bacterium]